MKRFRAFIKKEIFHIIRDKRTLLILFGMPVIQILLFGYAITNEIQNVRIGILDKSHDAHTLALTNKLLSSGYFSIDSHLDHEQEIEQLFQRGQVKMVVVFGQQFGRKLDQGHNATLQLLADATDPNTANTLINYASAISSSYALEHSPGMAPFQIVVESRMRYNPELKSVYLFVPGLIAIILMLVSTMMTSISIAREKEIGTMEVLLASPMNPVQVILAKVIPYLLLSFLNALIILALGQFVFGVPITGSLVLLLLESLLFIVLALSLGILISTVAQSQQVALLISMMGLMLPTILLSGFIFPIENMPLVLQVISNIVPAKWFIVIVRGIMLKGSDLVFLWQETLILLGFVCFFIAVSARKFKIRLE